MFSDNFDILILKIYILMYFQIKKIHLKSTTPQYQIIEQSGKK